MAAHTSFLIFFFFLREMNHRLRDVVTRRGQAPCGAGALGAVLAADGPSVPSKARGRSDEATLCSPKPCKAQLS